MDYKEIAREVFEIEARAITNLSNVIDENFSAIVDILLSCTGNVILTGVGKSGIIANKISSTFSSIGLVSFYVSPLELFHGGLASVKQNDVLIAVSHSGNTDELIRCVKYVNALPATVVAITGNRQSELTFRANYVLSYKIDKEACPLNIVPTTSTTTSLVIGDALACAVMKAKGITLEDFKRSHPGGRIGKF